MLLRKSLCPWAALLLFAAMVGCGSGDPKVVKVSGTLTYKGQAVPNANLDFVPTQGRPSAGETDAQGRFTLHYDRKQDGAVTGKHKVTIRQSLAGSLEPGKAAPLSPEMAAFYNKYGPANSKLEVTIDKATDDLKLALD
jgi:hypothetical protein